MEGGEINKMLPIVKAGRQEHGARFTIPLLSSVFENVHNNKFQNFTVIKKCASVCGSHGTQYKNPFLLWISV